MSAIVDAPVDTRAVHSPTGTDAFGRDIEHVLDDLRSALLPREMARVEQLLRLLTARHNAGLGRMLTIVGAVAPEVVGHLTADEIISSLLLASGMHPEPLRTRVESGLDSVRPFLHRSDCDAEVLDLDERAGALRVRLVVGGAGWACLPLPVELAVERAIRDFAPDLAFIDIDTKQPNELVGVLT